MEIQMENGQVVVRKRGALRIHAGHLWIYRDDILDDGGAAAGSIVAVRDERGAVVGKAFYSNRSKIALRFLARGDAAIDRNFFLKRFEQADRLRTLVGSDPALGRRINSEGDLLPGLIVDKYGDYLVVQSLIQGTDTATPVFLNILEERYSPQAILLRNDNKVREFEGLELRQDVVGGEVPDEIEVVEGSRRLGVPLKTGHKTGSYLDQKENRAAARQYASGRALDGFSYNGGFAIQIADRCERVEAIDISAAATRLAESNARRNNLNNVECREANVFDYLREQFAAGARYDTIILDPPAFAKNRENVKAALRGYKELNNRAMRLLNDGGILVTCTCSHHIDEGAFAQMLAESANDAGRLMRVLERRVQSQDHPILMTVPETLYLKCFILQIIY